MHRSQLPTVSALPRAWVGTGNLLFMHVTPPGITTHDSLCYPPNLGRHWTFTVYGRYTTRDHNSRQSLLSPGSQLTTVSALPRTWVGTGHLLSMHVIPPGITTYDSLCSSPYLGRHWKFTLYARYTTRDHKSRQSLLSPLSGQALEMYSLCTLYSQGLQLTTVSALTPVWAGTGHLLSMDVTPPGITTHDSLCFPPLPG
ncbi:hypothetical protein J6590_074395 [Homalodisca vitripennis]|nr:hypothetical protein J6590_074392 [Homalodisca vitripennis]KAG8309899.1 hypothetical protein J6590_074395 [Homalodisca vitripennis]